MLLLLKEKNTKTLISGDKVTRLVLETTDPEQVSELAELDNAVLVNVEIKSEEL